MVEGEEDSGAPCSMVVGAKKKVKTKEMKKTFSFILELKDLSSKEYNEFNWLDLVAQEEEKSKRVLFPANDLQDDEECKALARKYEAKYGVEAIKKKKKVRKLDDYADLGYGYDSNDPFIDNSDVYDEIVPRDVTTAYGGFYVNSGPLEFKERESANEESDPDTSKNILSVPSTTKKRKRPKKDIESNTPMSSKTQELPSKKINRKETNSKSSNRSKKRNLDGNVTKNSKANNNSDKPKKKAKKVIKVSTPGSETVKKIENNSEVQDTQLQLLAATVKETIKNIPLPSKNNVSSTTSSTPTANSLSVNSPTTQSLTPSTTSSSAKSKKSHSSANKVSSKKQHPLSQPNFDVNSYSDGLKVKSTAEQLNVLAKSSAISVTKQSVSGGGSKNSQSYVDVINSITGSNSKTLNEAAKSYLEFANALAVATSASQNSYPNHIVSPSVATASKQLPGSVTVESLSHKGKSPKVQVPNKSLSPMSRSGGIKSSTSHSNNSDINSVSIQSMPGKQMQQHFKSSSPHVTITKSSNANISSSSKDENNKSKDENLKLKWFEDEKKKQSIKQDQIKKLQSPPQNANPFSLDQCKNANNSDNPKQFQEHLHKPDQEKVRQQLKLEQETQRQIKQDQERQRQQVKQEQEKHRQRQQQISLEKEKQRQQQIKQDQELQIQQKIKQEQERQRQHQLKQEQERQRQQQLKQEQERQRQQQLKQEQERQRQQQLKQEQERQRQQQLKQEQERQLKQEQERQRQQQLKQEQERQRQQQLKQEQERQRQQQLKQEQERQLKQEQERQRQHQLKQEQERQRQHQLKQEQERQRQQQLKQEQERQRQQQIKQEQERQRQQQLKQEQERKRQQQIKHEQERKLQQQIIQEHERQLQQQLKQEQERQRQISLEKERQRQQQIKEHERQRQQQLKQDQERQRQFQQQQHQEIFKQQQMQIHQEQVQQQFLLQQTASPFMVQSPNYGNSVPASSSSKTSNSLSFMQQPPSQSVSQMLPTIPCSISPSYSADTQQQQIFVSPQNSVISGLHITSPPPSATNSTTFYVPK
uniref:Ubinuclein2like [Aplysia californica] n=1 Tax=Lepeophtheirus salmonis TaxID=72036 RepID=A0A0K2TV05_LEPSM